MFRKRSFFPFIMLALSVLLLVLAACGGDNDDTASSEGSGNDNSNNNNANEATEGSSDFYDGESIEMVVPFSAGGGSDVLARYFAPFFSDHVEGNPAVQVINIDGAGSVIGTNEYANFRDPDGYSTLWTSGSTAINYLLQAEGVDYDYKDFSPILGIAVGGVVYASPSTGIEEPADILNPAEPLINSGQSATGLDLITLLSFEILGADVESVLGYEGNGPARVAFEQGEVNVNYQTSPAYLSNVEPLVENGDALPLYSIGQITADGDLVRDPAFPDIPSFKEFYEEVHGEEPSGEGWEAYKAFTAAAYSMQKVLWVHDETPQEAVETLRRGAEGLAQDDEFIEKGDEVLGGYLPTVGDELVKQIENTVQADIDDSVMDWVFEFLEREFEVEL